MNARQSRFCTEYVVTGCAAEAARRAGYSPRTARAQGQRLLADVNICQHIRELQDAAEDVQIATMQQVRRFWSDCMNDEAQKMADRLKASELLAKSAGAFLPTLGTESQSALACDADGNSDVIIYMPQLDDEQSCLVDDDEAAGGISRLV